MLEGQDGLRIDLQAMALTNAALVTDLVRVKKEKKNLQAALEEEKLKRQEALNAPRGLEKEFDQLVFHNQTLLANMNMTQKEVGWEACS